MASRSVPCFQRFMIKGSAICPGLVRATTLKASSFESISNLGVKRSFTTGLCQNGSIACGDALRLTRGVSRSSISANTNGASRVSSFRSIWISPIRLRPRVPIGRIDVQRIQVEVPRGSAGRGSDDFFSHGGSSRSIWKPILFAAGLSASAYVLGAVYTNKDTDEWSAKLGSGSWWRRRTGGVDDDEIYRAKTLATAARLQQTLDNLPHSLSWLPQGIQVPITRIYVTLSEAYLSTPPAQRVCAAIIGFNGLVFLAWKIPSLAPAMRRWWMHWPVGSNHRVVTLATSVFSHQSLPHYAFNSIALYSFGSAAYTYLSHVIDDEFYRETYAAMHQIASSTTSWHFLAFFLTAGLFSSLSSHLSTVLVRFPRLLRDISSPARISSISALASNSAVLPSLGASGAIYATLTMTALAYPDAKVSLIFLPMMPIAIGWGMAGMVLVDALGVIRGWKMFDHVAHLSGAAFGFFYYRYGKDFWTWLRIQLGAKEKSSVA